MSKKVKNIEQPKVGLPGLISKQPEVYKPISKDEVVEVKKGKIRRSGHLTDNMLKYTLPNKQPDLFTYLQEETKRNIENTGVEITQIAEGIKLTPSEIKVVDCLCTLLHNNSQTTEPKNPNYYSGNKGFEMVTFGGNGGTTPAPKLGFSLYELTREYKGGEAVSGKDVDNIKQILTGLDDKKFLLSYVETSKRKDGSRVETKIETFTRLIQILKMSQTEFSKEDVEVSKKEETIVLLNPIFRRQIDSKFILFPEDLLRRTIIAYGSHNLSDIALRLRDYLIRELSSKHYTPEITQEKLYYMLSEKWMKESRKKKIKEYLDKAIEMVKALGLLLVHEVKTSSKGEPKYIFHLKKDWE